MYTFSLKIVNLRYFSKLATNIDDAMSQKIGYPEYFDINESFQFLHTVLFLSVHHSIP